MALDTTASSIRQRPRLLLLLFAGAALLCPGLQIGAQQPCTLDRATGTTIDKNLFLKGGYGSHWNAATNRVAYMQPGEDGYYRVFTMQPDGSDKRAIAEGNAKVPTKHQGSPYWHPSGRYLMFVAEKPQWHSPKLFGSPDYEALPGFGLHSDIWLITADGKQAWQLTDDPNSKTQGVLLPRFSPDGKHVAWSERQPDKTYVIDLADFVEAPQPHLANIRHYSPGGRHYYETGTFTSDSRSLTYTSDQDTHNFWLSQIYLLNLASGTGTRLTHGDMAYNEHPMVVPTPRGDWIVYMSTRDIHRRLGHMLLGTDWWAMRTDGSGNKRLTTMNAPPGTSPESDGSMQVACTVSPAPSGDYVLGDVQDSLAKQTGNVRIVRFVCGH